MRNVLWSDETKIEQFCHHDHCYVRRKKGGGLQAEEHHPNREARGWQHHVVGCFAAGRTVALHKIDGVMRKGNGDILKQHLKTLVQMDNDPKHASKVVAKWLKDNKVKVLEWPSQSSDFNPIENLWTDVKKCVRARRPTNLTQLHQLCQEEWAKIHTTYCGKLMEGYLKRLAKLKQFKGNATKY